jgi:hypothetical protein
MADTHSFFTHQHEMLNRMEASIEKFKQDLEHTRTEQANAVRARREKVVAEAQARRSEMEQAQSRVKKHVEAKKAETTSAVNDWKANLKIDLLELRAEDAESYADAMGALAEMGIEQSLEATLAAVEARREVDEALAVKQK